MKKQNQLSNRTVRLLRAACASILAETCAYNQSNWGGGEGGVAKYPSCGSPACLVGWMVFHATKWRLARERRRSWKAYLKDAKRCGASGYFDSKKVEKLLGLTRHQLNLLYWTDEWPQEFRNHNSDDAENATARVNRFIKTDGDE